MKTHQLKTWPDFFWPVYYGDKPFEVRKNDRDFQVGDILDLREWNPSTGEYTGEACRMTVTYVLGGGAFGVEKDHCVLGLALP